MPLGRIDLEYELDDECILIYTSEERLGTIQVLSRMLGRTLKEMPLLLLPHSQRNIHYSRGSKAQDPADIRAVRTTSNAASNRADPPRLTHREQGQNCTHDPSN